LPNADVFASSPDHTWSARRLRRGTAMAETGTCDRRRFSTHYLVGVQRCRSSNLLQGVVSPTGGRRVSAKTTPSATTRRQRKERTEIFSRRTPFKHVIRNARISSSNRTSISRDASARPIPPSSDVRSDDDQSSTETPNETRISLAASCSAFFLTRSTPIPT